MKKIGFRYNDYLPKKEESLNEISEEIIEPKKCLVKIKFPNIHKPYTYYNEFFDLTAGDKVLVSGRLQELIGVVVEVIYNFKIDLSKYERVVRKIETHIKGEFYVQDKYMLTFQKSAIPYEKVLTWFYIYSKGGEFVEGSDGVSYKLCDLLEDAKNNEACKHFYSHDKILYISLHNYQGYAIVEDEEIRLIEFKYNHKKSEITEFYCDCFEPDICEHQLATILMLGNALKRIDEDYSDEFSKTGYFAFVKRKVLETYSIDSKVSGKVVLD